MKFLGAQNICKNENLTFETVDYFLITGLGRNSLSLGLTVRVAEVSWADAGGGEGDGVLGKGGGGIECDWDASDP